MEIPDDDRVANLRWKKTAKRSTPPPPPTADEINIAESLLLLALSGGGFCNPTLLDTAPRPHYRPKKHHKISPSAAEISGAATSDSANVKKQKELSPKTPLRNSRGFGQVNFQSFQALGGHMITVSDDKLRRNSAVGESGGFHECSSCHERFPTGQALGGHKRKHYDGPPLAGKPTKIKFKFPKGAAGDSGGESSGGGATTRDVDRPVFHFDLNLPPPPDD